jgi:hypothetical protein
MKIGPAEETSFLRSVRISGPQFHRRSLAQVKSGPNVFADALVPQAGADARRSGFPNPVEQMI